jgi:hypothetical protein
LLNERVLALAVNDADDLANHDVLYARRTGVRQMYFVLPAQTKVLGFLIFGGCCDEL